MGLRFHISIVAQIRKRRADNPRVIPAKAGIHCMRCGVV